MKEISTDFFSVNEYLQFILSLRVYQFTYIFLIPLLLQEIVFDYGTHVSLLSNIGLDILKILCGLVQAPRFCLAARSG